jgi:hypothetical protein
VKTLLWSVFFTFALSVFSAASIHVSVAPSGDRLRFVVIETMRDLVYHRPATRTYEFTTPMNAVIRADEIRGYHVRYQGADGTWNTSREPPAGYILLSHYQHPKTVEFRLLERPEVAYTVPMTINGKHRVKTLHR